MNKQRKQKACKITNKTSQNTDAHMQLNFYLIQLTGTAQCKQRHPVETDTFQHDNKRPNVTQNKQQLKLLQIQHQNRFTYTPNYYIKCQIKCASE
jgi:hypothetical protein